VAKGRIGLDIGSTAVRAVELTGGDRPTVIHAAQVALPPGAVENGEVRDPAAVAEALKQLWQAGGFKQRRVYMGVGNQRVVVREIALPYLPEKELKSSLPFQVQEFIPMPVDDAVLDYDPVGEFEQDGRKMLRMLLVAAQRGMVDQMVSAALDAKLEPVGLDLIPFAMVRAVGSADAGMDLEEGGDEAVIDIGAHVTNIVVHARGTTRFVRILPSGGRDVTLAVAKGLGIEDHLAERLKRGEPLEAPQDLPPGQEPPPPPDRAQVHDLAIQRATSFVDEIRSSLEFYTAQAQGARIDRVVVAGGGSKLEGFVDLLRQRIPVQIDQGKVFEHVQHNLTLSDEALAEAEPLLAVAVGLAIPGRAS
jgi:type IV pilus assembly protein PilM